MDIHAFSMYISMEMSNHIQQQVPLMSQLTVQLHSQSLHHYTLLQLHGNTAALTSLLHHHHWACSWDWCLNANISVQYCQPLHRRNTFLSHNYYFASLLRLQGNLHKTVLGTSTDTNNLLVNWTLLKRLSRQQRVFDTLERRNSSQRGPHEPVKHFGCYSSGRVF